MNKFKYILIIILLLTTSCATLRHPFNKEKQQVFQEELNRKKVAKLKLKGTRELNDLFDKYPFLVDSLSTTMLVIDTLIEGDTLDGTIELETLDSLELENAVDVIMQNNNNSDSSRQVIREIIYRSAKPLLVEPLVIDTNNIVFTLTQNGNKLKYTIFVKPKQISLTTEVQQTQINTTSEIIYKTKKIFSYPGFWIAVGLNVLLLLLLLKRQR